MASCMQATLVGCHCEWSPCSVGIHSQTVGAKMSKQAKVRYGQRGQEEVQSALRKFEEEEIAFI